MVYKVARCNPEFWPKIEIKDEVPNGTNPSIWDEFGWGFKIKGPLPTLLQLKSTGKLWDLFAVVWHYTGISDQLRQIIEDIEPGVHQFFPVTILQRSGTPFDEKYYILNVAQKFNAQLHRPDQSDDSRREKFTLYGDQVPPYLELGAMNPAFSRPKIAGRHLWIHTDRLNKCAVMSDVMFKRWKKEKIRRYEVSPIKGSYQEVDNPWIAEEQIPVTLNWYTNALSDLKAGRDTEQAKHLIAYGREELPWLHEDCPSIAPEIAKHLNALTRKVLS